MKGRMLLMLVAAACMAAAAAAGDDDRFHGKPYAEYSQRMKKLYDSEPKIVATIAPENDHYIKGASDGGNQVWYEHESACQACAVDKASGNIVLRVLPVNADGFRDERLSTSFPSTLMAEPSGLAGGAANRLVLALRQLNYRVHGLHPLVQGGFVLVTLPERYDTKTGRSFSGSERYPKEVRGKKEFFLFRIIKSIFVPSEYRHFRQFVFVVRIQPPKVAKARPKRLETLSTKICLRRVGPPALPAFVEKLPTANMSCRVYVYRYVTKKEKPPPPPGARPKRHGFTAWDHVRKGGIAEALQTE